MERRRMFARRTGKALATSRAGLIAVFLIGLWLTPTQTSHCLIALYAVLWTYFVVAVGLMLVAWKSWWYEFRLAKLAHVVDIIAFQAAVFLSEINAGDFNSPYPTITAFLLVSATLRWGWGGVAWTSITLAILSTMVGLSLYAFAFDLDYLRFARRLMYFSIFAISAIWLSAEERTMRALPMPKIAGNPGERRTTILTEMLTFARNALQGKGAAIAVTRGEEPWTEVLRDTGDAVVHERIGPDVFEGSFGEPDRAALIDIPRARRITTRARTYPVALPGPFAAPLAAYCEVDEGILVTFETASGPGQLLIWGISDMSVDDLPLVEAMSRHLSTELDRESMAELAQATSSAALRDTLARDLHDSVAQFLAGTLFRLEALSRWIREGYDPAGEIADLRTALRREQSELRATIERLRRGEEGDRRTDVVNELEALLGELSHHWHIAVQLIAPVRPLPVSIGLAYELRQVLREAVANAARHGKCREVAVTLAPDGTHITLTIADDGSGFCEPAPVQRPKSISERVAALGGTLNICDNAPGVLLEIALPTRNAA